MTREIGLSMGKFALVDDEDYEWLSQWKWCAQTAYDGVRIYAGRTQTAPHRKHVSMHIVIAKPPDKLFVDHKDRNGLNNQRNNLRFCSNAQNQWNRGKSRANTSGYKGVSLHRKSGVYQAAIRFCGKSIYIGSFESPVDAAFAYDEVAVKLHGEFASVNFDIKEMR